MSTEFPRPGSTSRGDSLMHYRGTLIDTPALYLTLLEHPDVLDAVIVGDPVTAEDSLPVAFVVLQSSSAVSEEELIEHVASHVKPAQRLRGVYASYAPAVT